MIGITLECAQSKDVVLQISNHNARERTYVLELSSLVKALENDPDLGRLNPSDLPQLLQTIYVGTGCDYISFFSQVGKARCLKYFFQHASFIIDEGNPSTSGSLVHTCLTNNDRKHGLLSFLRLIGTVYFKKNVSAFDMQSPATHFAQFFIPLHLLKKSICVIISMSVDTDAL